MMKKRFLIAVSLAFAAFQFAPTIFAQINYEPFSFSTLAGLPGSVGVENGTGSAARFSSPADVAVDTAGNAYVADRLNSTIRKITPGGVVSTLAGLGGMAGSANGTGSEARFNAPGGVAVDSNGNVFVADTSNHTIRAITPGGVVTTVAGLAGSPGSDNGLGGAARFNNPSDVAVDGGGTLYVADALNHTIRKIAPGGQVSTFAGLASTPGSDDGQDASARFNVPIGVTVDSTNNVYVADRNNATVRKITSGGFVSTLAGMAGSFGTNDGTGAAARFVFPLGIAVNGGNVFLTDAGSHSIRKVTAGGVVTTLAGLPGVSGSADGNGSAARFKSPQGIAVDGAGKLYVADTGNHTIRVSGPRSVRAGNISTRARVGTGPEVLIGGFIITGTPPKRVIVRAVGPSLTQFGVPGAMQDPTVTLFDANSQPIRSNDNWRSTQETEIMASGVAPTDNREAALIETLPAGNYTAVVSGVGDETGVAVVEVYDLEPASTSRMGNIATRGKVFQGDNAMIAGFILSGTGTTQVVVRAIGPTLAQFGVVGPLDDTTLDLRDANGAQIASNDDWRSTQQQEIILAGLAPNDDREAAILANLGPGAYTAIVRGKNDTIGVALVEAYVAE